MTQTGTGREGSRQSESEAGSEAESASCARRVPGQMLLERLADSTSVERSWFQRALGVSPLSADDWPWFQGALGEQTVGRELDRLPHGWHAFHSLPVGTGASDIDHVVIGPPGIVTINTKHHRGARIWVRGLNVTVNGRRQQYLRAAQHESQRAVRTVSSGDGAVPVTACLAIVGADRLDVSGLPDGVLVVPARGLVRSLTALPARLTLPQVESGRASLASWSDAATPPSSEVLRHWALLKKGHREARSVSSAWRIAGIAAVALVVAQLGPEAIASTIATTFALINGSAG
jgi:hypothetical protein